MEELVKKTNLCMLIFSCLLFFLNVKAAFSDVLWTPKDDFFDWESTGRNQGCEIISDQYTVYSKSGKAIVKQTPFSNQILRSYENGTDFYILFICNPEGDQAWGVIRDVRLLSEASLSDDWDEGKGYVKMDDLQLSYGFYEFEAEHAKEFSSYNNEFNLFTMFTVWSYPGSELILHEEDRETVENKLRNPDYLNYEFTDTWTDNEGRIWIAVNMHHPIVHGWINLSDPTGSTPAIINDGFEWVDTSVDAPAVPEGAEAISDVEQLISDWRSKIFYVLPEHQTIIEFDATITKDEDNTGLDIQYTYGNLSYDGRKMVPDVKGMSVSYDASFTDGVLDVFDGVYHHKTFFWKKDGVLYGESISETPDRDYSRQISAYIR